MFGLYDIDSEEIKTAFDSLSPIFGFSPETPGLPRYENDYYQRANPESNGNWWYITSLWMAQYANEIGNAELAQKIVNWTLSQADPSSMFAEQINPDTGEPVSVSPLVWSHAEYMATMLDISERPSNA